MKPSKPTQVIVTSTKRKKPSTRRVCRSVSADACIIQAVRAGVAAGRGCHLSLSPVNFPEFLLTGCCGVPGRAQREDCEYERCGVAEVMMICQPAAGLRKCLVSRHEKVIG